MPDVTASGNEITDASRIAALEGDGIDAAAKRDGSYGIWEASENLIANGGFETNATGWTAVGATLIRDAAEAKFGGASGEITPANAAANEGGYHAFTGAAATKYTVSVWVWGTGTARIALYDDVSGKQACTAVTLTATPQRVTKTATTGGGAATFRVYVETGVQQAGVVNFDGVQVEAQPVATPYIETDGAAASRTAARVRMPASLLDETQAWVALCFRAGYADQTAPHDQHILFDWSDDTSNRFKIYFNDGLRRYYIGRYNGGASDARGAGCSYSKGDVKLVIVAWDATEVHISVNGVAFLSAGDGDIPTLSAATFDIGQDGQALADKAADHSFLWVACGTGVLTDADAAAIALLGNGAYPCDFPAAAVVTACWNADDDSYHVPEENVRSAELAAALR